MPKKIPKWLDQPLIGASIGAFAAGAFLGPGPKSPVFEDAVVGYAVIFLGAAIAMLVQMVVRIALAIKLASPPPETQKREKRELEHHLSLLERTGNLYQDPDDGSMNIGLEQPDSNQVTKGAN